MITLPEALSSSVAARRITSRPVLRPWGYLALIAAAELCIALVSPLLGLALYGLFLMGFLLYSGLGHNERERALTLALALAPIMRLLLLAPLPANLPRLVWSPLVLLALLLSARLIIRQLGLAREELGLRSGHPLIQLMLMGGGLGLGAVQYMTNPQAPIVPVFSWDALLFAALVVLLAAGLIEELIFRGLFQSVAQQVLGSGALVYGALLFALMHINQRSPASFLFAFGLGLIFAYAVRWSGSIVGVALAHGLTNLSLFWLMPFLAQQASSQVDIIVRSLIAAGMLLAGIAWIILFVRPPAPRKRKVFSLPAPPGLRLRELRRTAGLKYTDLAVRTGIPARRLAEIEYDLLHPSTDQRQRIARALDIAPDQLW